MHGSVAYSALTQLDPMHLSWQGSLCASTTVQALFVKRKFRQAPFEWVYDGLSPVLLPDVLHSHKGLCIVLSMLYIIVAAPFGIDFAMMRVVQPAAEASLAGPSFAAQKCLGAARQLPTLTLNMLAIQAEDGAKFHAL